MVVAGLRIIAGRWRSRRITAPPPGGTRPMPDRVKEAIFDVLGSWLGTPGRLPPLEVLDLFAGSGSLGLEAVSRGAVGCVFVERNARVVTVLRDNLVTLQAEPSLHIEAADAWTCPPVRLDQGHGPFGLVFVDPPYADARDSGPAGKVAQLLDRVMADDLLTDEVIIVLHHERRVRFEPIIGRVWTPARRCEYGSTAITFLIRQGQAGRTPAEPEEHC